MLAIFQIGAAYSFGIVLALIVSGVDLNAYGYITHHRADMFLNIWGTLQPCCYDFLYPIQEIPSAQGITVRSVLMDLIEKL